MTKISNIRVVNCKLDDHGGPREIIIVGQDGGATAIRLLPEALERSHTVVLRMSVDNLVEVEYHTWAEVADEPKREAKPTEREG